MRVFGLAGFSAQQRARPARPHRLDSCAWVSARLAELLPLPLEAKQALLEMDDGKARLRRLNALVRPD